MELYRAIDKLDGLDSLFLVQGDRMCVSSFSGERDEWLDKDSMEFDAWVDEKLEWSRMQNKQRVW